MAIINTPKSFDKAQIDSAVLPKIEQFVDYVNQQFDQIVRAIQNNLSFADNFKAKVIDVSAYHNTELSLNQTASSILPLSVLGDSIHAYSTTVSNSGVQKITFKFGNPLNIRTRSVTFSSPWATYECESVANIQVGDKVKVTNQTNSYNNGTFIVAEVGTSTITVYNSAGVSATVADYVGSRESAKTVTLLLLS